MVCCYLEMQIVNSLVSDKEEKVRTNCCIFCEHRTPPPPSSSSCIELWRSTDGALSACASIISWRGGDSTINSAIVGCIVRYRCHGLSVYPV